MHQTASTMVMFAVHIFPYCFYFSEKTLLRDTRNYILIETRKNGNKKFD